MITINEITKRRINQLINEELGIADYVEKASRQLYKKIVNVLSDITGETYDNGVNTCNTEIQFDFNNVILNISIKCLNFFNKDIRQKYINDFPNEMFSEAASVYGKVFSEKRIIKNVWLNVLKISGQVQGNLLMTAISHELRHIYGQNMNNNNSFSKRKDNNLYIKCADLFNGGQTEIEREVGFLGYLSFDYERRALVEEFFTKISFYLESDEFDGNLFKIKNILSENNEVLNGINKMHTVLQKIINNNEPYIDVLQNLLYNSGINTSRFISRCKEAIEDLSKRYGKCIIKLKNDYPVLQRLNSTLENKLNGNKTPNKYQI